MLSRDEEMALLDVLSKRIKERLDELKSESRLELLELNQQHGVDRRAVEVNGAKVGTVSVSYAKAKPAVIPGKESELLEALREAGLTEEAPVKGWEDHVYVSGENAVIQDTGEDVTGVVEMLPERAKGVTVRITADKAVEALRPALQGMSVSGLLGA